MNNTATTKDPASGPARKGGGCLRLIVAGLVLVCVAAGWVYWLWVSEPVYWQEHKRFLETYPPAQRLEMAQAVERKILDKLSAVATGKADSGVKSTLFLSIEEINAWIDQRLSEWATNQGKEVPEYVTEPMVAIVDQQLVAAFRLVNPPVDQVVSIVTRVMIDQGVATVKVENVFGGRLEVPGAKAMAQAIETSAGDSEFGGVVRKVTEAFDGVQFDPVVKLNGQKIQVVAFELQEHGAMITFELVEDKG